MLMFFYSGLLIIALFGGIFSLTKWQISNDPSLLWIAPLCLFLFGSIITVAKIGKRKAHTQMLHLMRFLRRALDTIECKRTEY
jgi:cytochrome c-type biogenesis protein CcmH/NrfF